MPKMRSNDCKDILARFHARRDLRSRSGRILRFLRGGLISFYKRGIAWIQKVGGSDGGTS